VGANVSRARITAPSLRKWANYYVDPVDAAANPTSSPPFYWRDYEDALPVTVGDKLDFEIDNAANSELDFGLVWLGTGPIIPVKGKVFTVEADATTTLVPGAWTPAPILFDTSLEAGLYQVVGLYAHFTGAIAARFLFPGALNALRPGVIASTTGSKTMPTAFRFGEIGIWGAFQAAAPPQMECLGTAAATTERFYMDLVKGPTGLQAASITPTNMGTLFAGNP
jgi:hypothetical protein